MSDKDNSLRKRALITKTGKNMFIWVVVSSIILSISIVVSILLVQRILSFGHVIDEKNKTLQTLKDNNKAIPDLQNAIRALNSNQALLDTRANSTDQAVQVVLDALPSEPNSLALGASLQQVLLANISGLSVNSLSVTPVSGVESDTVATSSLQSSNSSNLPPSIQFTFQVSGTTASLIELLNKLEKSIRVIDTDSIKIESSGGVQSMTVQGRAYYQLQKKIELTTKTV